MAALKQRTDKVDRHRQRMRAAGFRPVQFWVPDTRAADFAERVRQQCLKLKGDPQVARHADGQVFLSFAPEAGHCRFEPESFDLTLGESWPYPGKPSDSGRTFADALRFK